MFKYFSFQSTSSTMSELITIKQVLDSIKLNGFESNNKNYLYTYCENFVNLITVRRYKENLKIHRNYVFYTNLINFVDSLNIEVIWVKGHSKKSLMTEKYQEIFSDVDNFARKKLRDQLMEPYV